MDGGVSLAAVTNLLDGFWTAAVAPLMSNVQLNLGALASPGSVTLPHAGQILGLIREQDAALGAGTMTIKTFINGSSINAQTITSSSAGRGKSLFSRGAFRFNADDYIDIRLSTDLSVSIVSKIIVYPLVAFD